MTQTTWQPGTTAVLRLDLGWPAPQPGDVLCTPGGAGYRVVRVVDSPHVEGRYTVVAERLAYRSPLTGTPRTWLIRWYRKSGPRGRGCCIRRPTAP